MPVIILINLPRAGRLSLEGQLEVYPPRLPAFPSEVVEPAANLNKEPGRVVVLRRRLQLLETSSARI
eukprot:2493461-Lingulodinium_polyedra.AAC.1